MRTREGHRSLGTTAFALLTSAVASLFCAGLLRAQTLTLDQALREARQANARLPVARLALAGAEARARQARGQLYPMLSVEGDVHEGAPQYYASGDALAALYARQTLYDGGALRAGEARSAAEVEALRAGYRTAERDVDYDVRVGYGRMERADSSLAFRQRTLERLRAYLAFVEAQQAGGRGVVADMLSARQRLASAEAELAAMGRDLNEARMELNDLLGREPEAPLELAALPSPAPPPAPTAAAAAGRPWLAAPEFGQAEGEVRQAEADVKAARAGRRLHAALELEAGVQPILGPAGDAPLNDGRGAGGEATLTFELPLWDLGIYKGRLAEAQAAVRETQQRRTVVTRQVHLAWSRAASNLSSLYEELQARDRGVAVARDAYLQAESLYRGGQGQALEVLDAFDAWAAAGQQRLDLIYSFRVADAELRRWGES
jgi:outer membrane protein TolC